MPEGKVPAGLDDARGGHDRLLERRVIRRLSASRIGRRPAHARGNYRSRRVSRSCVAVLITNITCVCSASRFSFSGWRRLRSRQASLWSSINQEKSMRCEFEEPTDARLHETWFATRAECGPHKPLPLPSGWHYAAL
jgi:hypothetical protein